MSYSVESICICSCGKLRMNNEDNFCFDGRIRENVDNTEEIRLSLKCRREERSFFAVFDGMGGEANGELASLTAAKAFNTALCRDGESEALRKICESMNEAVCRQAKESRCSYMGTTAVIVGIGGEDAYVCNIGDSRAYRFRAGELKCLSNDHTDHRREGKKGNLTQYLGIAPEEMLIEPYIIKTDVQQSDIFLLCSDGLSDMVSDEKIHEILTHGGDIEEHAALLTDCAMANGGKDNITVILAGINKL